MFIIDAHQDTRRSLLEVMLRGEIRESQVNDDRLGRLFKDLKSGETAVDLDRELNAHLIRYYRQRMR